MSITFSSAPIEFETAKKALNYQSDDDYEQKRIRSLAAELFFEGAVRKPTMSQLNSLATSFNPAERMAALGQSARLDGELRQAIFQGLIEHIDAWRYYEGPLPAEILEERLTRGGLALCDATEIAKKAQGQNYPRRRIHTWLCSGLVGLQMAAMCASYGRDDIPLTWLEIGLSDYSTSVREAARLAYARRAQDMPIDSAEKRFLKAGASCDASSPVSCRQTRGLQTAILQGFQGREDARGMAVMALWEGLNDDVRKAAAQALQGADLPVSSIRELFRPSSNWGIATLAGLYASIGRPDVPPDYLKHGRPDGPKDPRYLPYLTATRDRDDLPPVREFEPPKYVYESCLGGVVVVAEIPSAAQVVYEENCSRDNERYGCASEAKIVKIIGQFFGAKIGVHASIHSGQINHIYRTGDHFVMHDNNPDHFYEQSFQFCSRPEDVSLDKNYQPFKKRR